MNEFRAPRWLPGGHAQTIWPALFSRRFEGEPPAFERERWATPDHDFVDVDWLGADRAAPLLVLFHGLEGSSSSHYAQAFAGEARRRGWRYAVPHFRGCSGEINLAPRAYPSGDHEEVGWMLARFRALHDGPLVAVGVSLGGNALLRYAEEAGAHAVGCVRAVAAISAPLDLAAGARAIGRGFGRQVYTRMFMRTMKRKAFVKLAQHPGLFDAEAMRAARDLRDFDEVFTGPLHGFTGADDYYARASAKPQLARIAVPALVLNARNDPFLPGAALPGVHEVGAHVTLWQPAHGGHVGFAGGRWPGHVRSLPEQVAGWLGVHLR
ncbi:MAG: alpha/beta fold hydrolase [Caldimonas sp.]